MSEENEVILEDELAPTADVEVEQGEEELQLTDEQLDEIADIAIAALKDIL